MVMALPNNEPETSAPSTRVGAKASTVIVFALSITIGVVNIVALSTASFMVPPFRAKALVVAVIPVVAVLVVSPSATV